MKTRGEKDQQPLLIECPDGAGSFFFFFLSLLQGAWAPLLPPTPEKETRR